MELFEIVKTIGSAAGIAALITAIFNFVGLRKQHQRLLEIESFKKNTAIESFRYTRIYEALTEIQSFPSINYDLRNMERVVTETTERYGKLNAVFKRISPLLEPASLLNTRLLVEQEEALSRKLLEHIYAGGAEVPMKELLLKRQEIEAGVVVALSSNLTALTFPSDRSRFVEQIH